MSPSLAEYDPVKKAKEDCAFASFFLHIYVFTWDKGRIEGFHVLKYDHYSQGNIALCESIKQCKIHYRNFNVFFQKLEK